MSWLAWAALSWVVVAFVFFRRPECAFRGRILTMPLRRRSRFLDGLDGLSCRLAQVIAAGIAGSQVDIAYREPVGDAIAALVVIAVYLDDWLTGDDDRWRRFKSAARNRLRWLMDLPAEPEPGTA